MESVTGVYIKEIILNDAENMTLTALVRWIIEQNRQQSTLSH